MCVVLVLVLNERGEENLGECFLGSKDIWLLRKFIGLKILMGFYMFRECVLKLWEFMRDKESSFLG